MSGAESLEQNVLGALLKYGGDAWQAITPPLRAQAFAVPGHRTVYQAIEQLALAGEPCDVGHVLLRLNGGSPPGISLTRLTTETLIELRSVPEYARALLKAAEARDAQDREAYFNTAPGAQPAPDASEQGWTPPMVVSYGAAFNAATIPKRRWILGQRRAEGEVTIDVGAPGINKSMLSLTDAVATATGRRILADEVHVQGHVLLLVGEDARRDTEARLAAILTRHHILPADLGDRLHIVYLPEADDASAYTLAQMVEDSAALNRTMFDWLSGYPELIAIYVDPIVAWHRLIENSNDALKILCAGLRSVAVRGRRHVGFNHHVTKVAMSDPELYVHNLAAVRGAGVITSDARWIFTMAGLKSDTATQFGIPEAERWRYRRLDALKASHGPGGGDPRLLRVESVQIANGEDVGVLVEVDIQRAREAAAGIKADAALQYQEAITTALQRMLMEKRPRSANDAALWLIARHPELFQSKTGAPLSPDTLRKRLPTLIGSGVGKEACRIVVRDVEGKGSGYVIDFERQPAP